MAANVRADPDSQPVTDHRSGAAVAVITERFAPGGVELEAGLDEVEDGAAVVRVECAAAVLRVAAAAVLAGPAVASHHMAAAGVPAWVVVDSPTC
jgi:hypothetical protein